MIQILQIPGRNRWTKVFSPAHSWKLEGIFSNTHFLPVLIRTFRWEFKGQFSRLSSCVGVYVFWSGLISIEPDKTSLREDDFWFTLNSCLHYQRYSWWILHTPEVFQRDSVTLTSFWQLEILQRTVPRIPPKAGNMTEHAQSVLTWNLTFSKKT